MAAPNWPVPAISRVGRLGVLAVTDWSVVELAAHNFYGRSIGQYNCRDRTPRVLLVRVSAWVRLRARGRGSGQGLGRVDAGVGAGAGEVASAGVCACACACACACVRMRVRVRPVARAGAMVRGVAVGIGGVFNGVWYLLSISVLPGGCRSC